ncbi:MAG: lipoyl synthase [Actinomycetota bacterium]
MLNNRPDWLKKRIILNNANISEIKKLVEGSNLHTVCQSARCPNIFECFSKRTATFMLMGNRCTRNCAFCGIDSKEPFKLDENEPRNVSIAAVEMGLKYVVLTSVTRDDLPDGGARHFVRTIREIKERLPDCRIECLIPDLKGNIGHLKKIVSQNIAVLNHNMETIERNYPNIRPGARYDTSLKILMEAKKARPDIYTKSGFMVGLGESLKEIEVLLRDLKEVDCDIISIGQYLRPSVNNIGVEKYYTPDEFEQIARLAKEVGIKSVASGAFVRSSYKASLLLKDMEEGK